MFQIEPVLWLQSLESSWLTSLMTTVTNLGYSPVYALLLIVLIFGVRLKHGFYIFLALLISGILTDGLKRGLMFPRPSDVDSRVIEPGHVRPPLLIDNGAAKSFWSLPTSEARAVASIQTDWSYGFPSGHVAAATAFFIGLAFFFRSRGAFGFAFCWIFLMALSRMYLGRHFIADVIGGMAVGIFAVALAAFIVRPLTVENSNQSPMQKLFRWTILVIPLLVLAPFIELFDKENIGRLLGLYASYAVLLKIGIPSDKGNIFKRVGRVILVFLVFLLIDKGINPLLDTIILRDNSMAALIAVFLTTLASFIGTIVVARRLKLYEMDLN